jgi:hypothetical protein
LEVNDVPLPATFWLFGLGMTMLLMTHHRR